MNTCPCCSYPMLRHTRNQSVYWFCRHCWQEMPDVLELEAFHSQRQTLERMVKNPTLVPEKFVKKAFTLKHPDASLIQT